VQVRWEQIKQAERSADDPTNRGITDGIPASLPALARAQKVLRRLHRRGLDVPSFTPAKSPQGPEPRDDQRQQTLAIGAALLQVVEAAEAAGIDAEGALRMATATVERAAAEV
jgi:XTP/dITP diphosphohydrolase